MIPNDTIDYGIVVDGKRNISPLAFLRRTSDLV